MVKPRSVHLKTVNNATGQIIIGQIEVIVQVAVSTTTNLDGGEGGGDLSREEATYIEHLRSFNK